VSAKSGFDDGFAAGLALTAIASCMFYFIGTQAQGEAPDPAPASSPLVGTAQMLAGTRGPVFYGSLFGSKEKGCVVVDLSVEGWWYCPDRDCDGWSDELDPDAVNGWECKPLPCADGHCDDLRVFEFGKAEVEP